MSEWIPFDLIDGIPFSDVGESGGIGDPGPDEWLVEGTATDLQGGNVRIREFVYAHGKHIAIERALAQHVARNGLVVFDNPISPVLIWDHTKPLKVRTVFDTKAPPEGVVMPYRASRIHVNLRRRIATRIINREVKSIEYLAGIYADRKSSEPSNNEYMQGCLDAINAILPHVESIKHELSKCSIKEE